MPTSESRRLVDYLPNLERCQTLFRSATELADLAGYIREQHVPVPVRIQPRMSAVGQNRPLVVEIKGFKTSHFLEHKTAPLECPDAGPMGACRMS